MSSLKQVKDRISSIDKIVKITQAMEVVSMVRLRRIEKSALSHMQYFAAFQAALDEIGLRLNHAPHTFFTFARPKKPLVLCIGSDKGLCGGFNLFVTNELAAKAFIRT